MSEFYADDITWNARDLNTTDGTDIDSTNYKVPFPTVAGAYQLVTLNKANATLRVEQAKNAAHLARQKTRKAISYSQSAFRHWIDFIEIANELRAANIHKDVYKVGWVDFCRTILEVHDSRVRQLKKAYPYAKALIAAGITDLTESDLRHIPKGITPDNPDLATIFQTARGTMLSVFGSEAAPTAAVYNAILDVLETAQATGGYVDTGDGEMTALEATIIKTLREDFLEQQELIRAGGRWEELQRKSWRCNEPGALGIATAAGLTIDAHDADIEIVVIVRKAKTED